MSMNPGGVQVLKAMLKLKKVVVAKRDDEKTGAAQQGEKAHPLHKEFLIGERGQTAVLATERLCRPGWGLTAAWGEGLGRREGRQGGFSRCRDAERPPRPGWSWGGVPFFEGTEAVFPRGGQKPESNDIKGNTGWRGEAVLRVMVIQRVPLFMGNRMGAGD